MIQSTTKFSQTKTQQLNPQIFTIWSDEIEGRIDPEYYSIELYYSQAKNLKKEAREVLENAKEKVEEMILE